MSLFKDIVDSILLEDVQISKVNDAISKTYEVKINYQTDNNRGEYLLSSSTVYKWKLPGTFSEPHLHTTKWKFVLTTKNTQINQVNLGTAFTIYARKNIV